MGASTFRLARPRSRTARSTIFIAVVAAVLLALALAARPASAADALPNQNFDTATTVPPSWQIHDIPSGGPTTTKNYWHIQANPQNFQVKNPDINPNLVTLPDSGFLLPAHSGANAAWFGEQDTGTFCGKELNFAVQDPKSGCVSGAGTSPVKSGDLKTAAFDLNPAPGGATLHFWSWFEIEAVDADVFDTMKIFYSIDNGATWNSDPVKMNPASNPAGGHDQSYSNNGFEQPPSWQEYFVDLSPAVTGTSDNVKVKFEFNTVDSLYQGFRGWFIDDVKVVTPYDVPAPAITGVIACANQANAPVTVIQGTNFVLGSKVFLDGTEIPDAASPSSTRIEIPQVTEGQHTVQVVTPHNDASNTFSFTAGGCAPPAPVPFVPAVLPAPSPNSLFSLIGTPKQVPGFGLTFIFNTAQFGTASVFGSKTQFPKTTAARIAALVDAKKCKKGQKKQGKKCIKKVAMTYGPKSGTGGPGQTAVTVFPGAQALKVLKKGKNLTLPFRLAFQSALGGTPSVSFQNVTVKGKKPATKCKKGFKKKGKKCVKK